MLQSSGSLGEAVAAAAPPSRGASLRSGASTSPGRPPLRSFALAEGVLGAVIVPSSALCPDDPPVVRPVSPDTPSALLPMVDGVISLPTGGFGVLILPTLLLPGLGNALTAAGWLRVHRLLLSASPPLQVTLPSILSPALAFIRGEVWAFS